MITTSKKARKLLEIDFNKFFLKHQFQESGGSNK